MNEWSRVESLQVCWYIKSKGQHGSLLRFLSIKFCIRDFLNHKNKGHTRKVDKPRWNNTKMYYSISARSQNIELCFHLPVNWVEFNRSVSCKFSAGGCWATAVEHGHIYYMSAIFEFNLPLKLLLQWCLVYRDTNKHSRNKNVLEETSSLMILIQYGPFRKIIHHKDGSGSADNFSPDFLLGVGWSRQKLCPLLIWKRMIKAG